MSIDKELRCERVAGRVRPLPYLADEVVRYDLSTCEGIEELKANVRTTWSCREINFFSSFLHGGSFRSDTGKWTAVLSGISTRTYREDRNLESAWLNLLFFANAFIGAAAALGLMNSRIVGPVMMTDEGDCPTLWDMTIYELAKMISSAKRRNVATDMIAKIEELGKDVKDVKFVVGQMVPSHNDYVVSVVQLSQLLEKLGSRRSARIIQRWEKYLRGDSANGTKPPQGYTLYTRVSVESATAWAKSYATTQLSKLRTKISFESLFGGRR